MDKNSTIGMGLIMAILLGWYFFFLPKTEPAPANKTTQTEQVKAGDTLSNKTTDMIAPVPAPNDSARLQMQQQMFGAFAPLTVGEAKTLEVKTENATYKIQTKGGNVSAIYLLNHKDQNLQPLPIILEGSDNQQYEEFVYAGKSIKSSDLFFTPVGQAPTQLSGGQSATLTLKAALDETRFVEKTFTFKGDSYDVQYGFRLAGLSDGLKDNGYTLIWNAVLPQTEKITETQRNKSTIAYSVAEDVEKMGFKAEETATSEGKVEWAAFRSQFFTFALIPDTAFQSGDFSFSTPEDLKINKIMHAKLAVNVPKSNDMRAGYKMFAGPMEYDLMRTHGKGFHKQMDLGWGPVKYINAVAMWVFKRFEKLNISYGIIILIFGFLIKLVVFPMTYKSYMSMAKLRVLNQLPEMKEMEAKYQDDAQKLQMEKMAIYNKMGVSPFGGCLPMLLQYPIIISMFFLFPQAVELRHQPFLWATDLSSFDSIYDFGFKVPGYGDHISLFTILMAISTFFYTYYTQSSQPTATGNPAMQMQMKIMMYIMPFFLLFFLNNYASGLSWYYFVSNLLAIGQNLLFRYFVDDQKLEAQLIAAQKSKPKGGGMAGIQKWLEDQQQKQISQTQNKNNKK